MPISQQNQYIFLRSVELGLCILTLWISLYDCCTYLEGCVRIIFYGILKYRFNMDPATASGPLITSLADIAGVLIYFSIAAWYLGMG